MKKFKNFKKCRFCDKCGTTHRHHRHHEKKAHEHKWVVVRETTELEFQLTNKEFYVQCSECGGFGYCNQKDLDFIGVDTDEKAN
jgi:hypothetical protein